MHTADGRTQTELSNLGVQSLLIGSPDCGLVNFKGLEFRLGDVRKGKRDRFRMTDEGGVTLVRRNGLGIFHTQEGLALREEQIKKEKAANARANRLMLEGFNI